MSASTARPGSTSRCSSTAPANGSPTSVRGKRVGVYGLDYVMTVRDYAALARRVRARRPGTSRSTTRAMVKSELELASVRDCVRINTEGFWIFLEHFEPGKTEREVLAPCEEYFVDAGLRPLDDGHGARRRRTARRCRSSRSPARAAFGATDCVLPSLEVAGPGGHWVEVSRAICPGEPSDDTKRMLEAYEEYYAAAPAALRRAHRARRASRGREGLPRSRLPSRPRHRPFDRDDDDRVPEDRRGRRDRAARPEWCSRCTRTRSRQDGQACLYMQDTWLVTADGGVPLADLPMKIFDGTESALGSRMAKTEPDEFAPILPGAGGERLRALSAHGRAARAAEGRRTNGCIATSCSSRPCTSRRSSG